MSNVRVPAWQSLWVALSACVLGGIAFLPTFTWLAVSWLGDPYYGHGLLVPLISLLLVWRVERRPRALGPHETHPSAPHAVGLVGLGLSVVVALIAQTRLAYVLSAFCLVTVVAFSMLSLGGLPAVHRHAFALGFLLLMVPLPWLDLGSPSLARWSAAQAAGICRMIGVPTVASGARIDLPGAAFSVGASCSGINSLAALCTLAVLYAHLLRGPLVSRLALVLLALPLALAANTLRLGLLVGLAATAGTDAALGYYHNWSSPLLFLAALGLLIAAGRWMGCDALRRDL